MAITGCREERLPIQLAFHAHKYTTFRPMVKLFAKTIARILSFFRWKRSVVFANLQLTQNWSGWQGNPPEPELFYQEFLNSISLEFVQFLFGFKRTTVRVAVGSESVLEEMKKGGVLLTAHLGNWEYLGSTLCKMGIPLVATYLPFPHRTSNLALAILRRRNGNRVQRFEDNPFAIRKQLKSGNLFTFLADQDFRKGSAAQGAFLGNPVNCNPLPERIASWFPDMPFFWASLIRESDGNFVLKAQRISPCQELHYIYSVYHREFEHQLTQNPQQWAGWTHKRFLSTHSTLYSQK